MVYKKFCTRTEQFSYAFPHAKKYQIAITNLSISLGMARTFTRVQKALHIPSTKSSLDMHKINRSFSGTYTINTRLLDAYIVDESYINTVIKSLLDTYKIRRILFEQP